MHKRFDPIEGLSAIIIDAVMSSEDMPSDEGLLFKLRLAVEEAVENIVNYAYSDGAGYLEADTSVKDGVLSIVLQDAGVPFNPLDKEDPDITLSAEDRPIGGLGIFLCKKLMDSVEYEFVNGCNKLTIRKRIA